jgi:hypothetical protein
VIRNVLLCGNRSKNGYDIPEKAFGGSEGVKRLYEGKPVFLNHPESESKPRDRRVQDIGGWVKNARLEGGKPRGDIATKNAPQGEIVRTLAAARESNVGMSHVAFYRKNAARTSVESINEVISVDLVTFPATSRSVFEHQTGANMETVELLTKQLADQKTAFESQIKLLTDDKTSLTTKVADLEKQVTSLTGEKTELTTKVAQFESERNLAVRKAWIIDKCKEHKLNHEDKAVFTESFMGVLLGTADDGAREGLIKSIKAAVESVAAGNPLIISQERHSSSTATPASYEELTKKTGLPVFA